MAKRVRLFFISFLMLFIGNQLNADESPLYTQYVNDIVDDFAKQMKKEFGLDCEGSGGSMPHDVEEISIMFAVYQRATVEQARELEVKVTERFVQIINAHEKIRLFLRESPFPPSRTNVGISFLKRNNQPYLDGSVAYVSHVKNRIFYRAENPLNPYVFKAITDEPYEEARAIVHNQSLPLQ